MYRRGAKNDVVNNVFMSQSDGSDILPVVMLLSNRVLSFDGISIILFTSKIDTCRIRSWMLYLVLRSLNIIISITSVTCCDVIEIHEIEPSDPKVLCK